MCHQLSLPDPRHHGSLNPGTTNVYRMAGKRAAAFTLLGDMLKGFIPVYIASQFEFTLAQLGWIATAAVLGHLWPIFFHFRGGKGVATALGAVSALNLLLVAVLVSVWIISFFLFKYSSVASINSSISAPLASYILTPDIIYSVVVLMVLLLYRHQMNIRRLFNGTEPKTKRFSQLTSTQDS